MITIQKSNPLIYASELANQFLSQQHNVIVLAPTVELISTFSCSVLKHGKTYWISRSIGNYTAHFRAATRMCGLKSVAASRLILVFQIPEPARTLTIERLRGCFDPAVYQIHSLGKTQDQCRDEILSNAQV